MKGCIFTLKEKRQKTKYNIRRMAKKKKKKITMGVGRKQKIENTL